MSTTTPPETPARADTSSLNPDALKHLSTAAENRREKGMINLSKEATENLKTKVKGQIVLPSDSSYDAVREIWNAMIERRPALIQAPAISFHGLLRTILLICSADILGRGTGSCLTG
jgi:hypothetical protein